MRLARLVGLPQRFRQKSGNCIRIGRRAGGIARISLEAPFFQGPGVAMVSLFPMPRLADKTSGSPPQNGSAGSERKADGVSGQEDGGSKSASRCAGERSLGVRYSVRDSAAGRAPRKPAATPYDGLMIASPTGWPPSIRTRRPSTCSRPSEKSCTALG